MQHTPYIQSWIQVNKDKIYKNGKQIEEIDSSNSLDFLVTWYKQQEISYPKFFKMDLLSKLGYLSSEIILKDVLLSEQKEDVAVVIFTKDGSLIVDRQFDDSRRNLASPALFVYTLPNIVLGEICIKFGFKGEQACFVDQQLNTSFLDFYLHDLFQNRKMNYALCGFLNAHDASLSAELMWVSKHKSDLILNEKNIESIFSFN